MDATTAKQKGEHQQNRRLERPAAWCFIMCKLSTLRRFLVVRCLDCVTPLVFTARANGGGGGRSS
jgi:hypothetical protein